MSLDQELEEYAARRSGSAPTRADGEALLRRVAQRRVRRRFRWVVCGASGGLVAAAAAGMVWIASSAPVGVQQPEIAVVAPAQRLFVDGVHRVGDDILTVAGSVRVQEAPDEVRVQLIAGRVGVQAAVRAEGQRLLVVSGGHTVQVVGTRFDVVQEPFDVVVYEGIVDVHGPAGTRRLLAGERFARVPEAPPVPTIVRKAAPPSLSTLTEWVLAGRQEEARAGLERRLVAQPHDVPAWRLLARLETLADRPDDAGLAWKAVVTHGDASQRREACLALSDLYDSQPAAARMWVEMAAEDPGELAPEIGLRLGRLRLRTADLAGARAAFSAVVSEHPQTAAATAASRELAALPR